MSKGEDEVSDRRFSDPLLIQFHEDFMQLKFKFYKHLEEEDDAVRELIRVQGENTEAIRSLHTIVTEQADKTEWVISLSEDAKTIARFAVGLQKFAKWVLSIIALGSAVTLLLEWLAKGL